MSEPSDSPPSDASPHLRPTHQLEQLKVGENGVQLLISTKDHLYNAKDVEAGRCGFQCVGAWSDDSVRELGQMLISHRNHMSQSQTPETEEPRSFRGPGYTMRGVVHGSKSSP
ncbi:uncharacterized protein LY79DRAFT_565534 [Colletotrichum navitas]|uniref:Uncharacterized protein n=1 Tax=Colletotrichum navitas TaxID=681940 RepID=A0AAD8PQT5_9PEZI|nr:uncharacterized protein LY79DRAFT_565534 [Colletotrichum navitas]KAK1574576.1 hypothetical protein LY79DRAFT_565534 [Colletotrichum navitas]